MKRNIIFFILSTFTLFGSAQSYTTVFSYDNAGNRIRQKVAISTYSISKKSSRSVFDSIPNKGITEELLSCKVTIYPNPTKGIVSLQISGVDESATSQIDVYTESGQLLRKITGEGNTIIPIDLTQYPIGIYIINFCQENNKHIYKIIKQ